LILRLRKCRRSSRAPSDTAFITDSGKGAIIVVNLKNGNARRLFEGHPSTQPEKDFKLVVDGRELIDQQKKAPPQIASDGIALDSKNGYLYYHALTAHKLYRIKTSFLTDEHLSRKDLESKVEYVGQTPAPDGMLEALDGSVYLTDLEHNAVVHWNAETKSIEQIIADKRLRWPDTLSSGRTANFTSPHRRSRTCRVLTMASPRALRRTSFGRS
jgi:sugar lactone lactonase YvrE